jgi:hypothetical protein
MSTTLPRHVFTLLILFPTHINARDGKRCFFMVFSSGEGELFILFVTHDRADMPGEHETLKLRFTLRGMFHLLVF